MTSSTPSSFAVRKKHGNAMPCAVFWSTGFFGHKKPDLSGKKREEGDGRPRKSQTGGGITRSNGKWSKEVAIMDNGLIGKWPNGSWFNGKLEMV